MSTNFEKIMSRCPRLSALAAARREAATQVLPDRVQQLAVGLSTAKTIAEIRTVAKQILDETGGGESNE